MKSFVALFAVLAIVAADVAHLRSPEADAPIVEQEADVFPDSYKHSYKTGNGIAAEESGVLANPGRENEGIAATGSFSYVNPEGETVALTYVADENGFQPQGAHLPVAHPIPDYILRSLEFIRTHARPEVAQK